MSKLIFEACAMQRFSLFGNVDTPSLTQGRAALGTYLENLVFGRMAFECLQRHMMCTAMQISLRVRSQYKKEGLLSLKTTVWESSALSVPFAFDYTIN